MKQMISLLTFAISGTAFAGVLPIKDGRYVQSGTECSYHLDEITYQGDSIQQDMTGGSSSTCTIKDVTQNGRITIAKVVCKVAGKTDPVMFETKVSPIDADNVALAQKNAAGVQSDWFAYKFCPNSL